MEIRPEKRSDFNWWWSPLQRLLSLLRGHNSLSRDFQNLGAESKNCSMIREVQEDWTSERSVFEIYPADLNVPQANSSEGFEKKTYVLFSVILRRKMMFSLLSYTSNSACTNTST